MKVYYFYFELASEKWIFDLKFTKSVLEINYLFLFVMYSKFKYIYSQCFWEKIHKMVSSANSRLVGFFQSFITGKVVVLISILVLLDFYQFLKSKHRKIKTHYCQKGSRIWSASCTIAWSEEWAYSKPIIGDII